MKRNILSLIVLCFLPFMAINAQTEKIKVFESAFIQGGETAYEAFGVSKPESLLVFNSKTNTKYSRICFMKFKLPEGLDCLTTADLTIQIRAFKNKEFPDSKFDLDVQAVPEGRWSSQSITFNNAPKLGDIIGSAQINQSLDDKFELVTIKLNVEAINKLIKEYKSRGITIALANNIPAKSGAAIGKDCYLTIN